MVMVMRTIMMVRMMMVMMVTKKKEGEADVDNVEDARDVEGYEEDFVDDCKEGFVGDYADDEVKVGGVKAEVGSSSLRTSPSQELSGTNINACTIPSNPLFVA